MLTMPRPEDMLGRIDAVRVNVGQKSAIVWRFNEREVWLDEVPVVGRKRALYDFARRGVSRRTLVLIWKLEGEAHEALDQLRAQNDETDVCAPVFIESDPYVTA